ncbi:zinc ribbon domain-containing protein [Terrimonas sp. NA20]|uniref:Zinc ribbon domain-containing protein n=1 Tax=Terrimonas ginsenosidimutans TaxID=2908004 RepID=A0ABS9KKU0_9BACT|nr:zinc-ribbon domain-containing protein [Terrimonas ginsenosidimutans]MCG2612938.1 zinc ribbon domain-containing protein [Terrimonas ginsenosidimutans]
MIIYGTRAKELAAENIVDRCPNCGSQNTLSIHVYQQYAHVFWIPFFPVRKVGASVCSHCKGVMKHKELPPNLQESYKTIKAQTKTPVWMFAGIALFAVLISAVAVSISQDNKRNAAYLASPQDGDVYELKTEGNHYGLILVEQIKGDSAYVRLSDYEVDKKVTISKLQSMNKGKFSEDLFVFSKAELKNMWDKGEIVDAKRGSE